MYSVFVFIFLFITLAAIFIYFSPVLYNVIYNKIITYKSEENVKKIKTIMSDLDENGGI
jgi:hypothetical protein